VDNQDWITTNSAFSNLNEDSGRLSVTRAEREELAVYWPMGQSDC